MQLFILIFLLSHVAMVTAVVGCQSDRDKDHRPRQNCTAGGFSDVPAGLEPSNKVLLFPNNLFSSVSWSSFQIFTDIYEIDLTGNKVPEVTPSASPVLPSLSVLRLGSNRLTSLSDGAFSACPALTELYLDNNAIRSLSDHTFSGLSKLEILDLSSNHIKVLPGLMLHPLTAIETLFLENNKINVMPDNWFSQKEEVPYLYLSANPWACSCSLDYLRTYLDNYEFNVYVRDGPIINSNAESVVCDSPRRLKGKPVLTLEESDLCSSATEPGPPGDFYQPVITNSPQKMATSATAVPTPPTTMTPPPPPPTTTSPPPPPPPLPTTTSPPPPPTTAPALAATPALVDLHTEHHRVVTWSWHQSFTRLVEWSVVTKSNTLSTHRTPPTARPSTESPADMTTATSTPPAKTTKPTPTSTTAKLQMLPTPTTTPPLVMDEAGSRQLGKVSSIGGAAVFCFWLFAGCFLLCVASAACILTTVARLVSWYRRVYRPLRETLERRRRRGGYEAVRLLGKEVGGGEGGAVNALYRSVLFIHQERPEAVQGEDGGKEGEGGEGGEERLVVPLEPPGGGGGGGVTREEGGQRKGMEERGVYRKTMYRLLSKEEEIEGWRDVMEECRVSAADGGRRGAVKDEEVLSTKRYSVILREERGAGGGREELDWVVGGWDVTRGAEGGAEEPRSSWGEWLAHYLPSMPWGVTTPHEGGAAK